jgi:hypothetical protein
MLLLNVRDLRSVRSLACAVLVGIGIGAGAWQWPATLRWRPDWPAWAAQVEAWERDARQELHIWPKGWRMRLFPRERGASTRS